MLPDVGIGGQGGAVIGYLAAAAGGALGASALGLLLGKRMHVSAYGMLGYTLLASRNLGEALRLAIARALILVQPEDRPALKRAGFLTRDPRAIERKKYGLKKARKAPQYSKR